MKKDRKVGCNRWSKAQRRTSNTVLMPLEDDTYCMRDPSRSRKNGKLSGDLVHTNSRNASIASEGSGLRPLQK